MEKLEHYLRLSYTITVVPEVCTDGSGCYVARVAELPGCESHGDTPEQALQHLDEARRLFLASMLEDGVNPPPPLSSPVWQVDAGQYRTQVRTSWSSPVVVSHFNGSPSQVFSKAAFVT